MLQKIRIKSCLAVGLTSPRLIHLIESFKNRSRIDRLHQMNVESGGSRLELVFLIAPSRHGDEYNVLAPGQLANSSGGFVAIEHRHSNIENDDVRTECFCLLDGFQAIESDLNLVAEDTKHHLKTFDDI